MIKFNCWKDKYAEKHRKVRLMKYQDWSLIKQSDIKLCKGPTVYNHYKIRRKSQ